MLEGPFIGIYLEANSRLQLARTQKKTQNKTEKRREARSGTSCNLQLGVWDPSARTAGSTVGLRITCLGITGLSGETSPCIWLSNAFALVTNDPYEIIVPGLPLPPTSRTTWPDVQRSRLARHQGDRPLRPPRHRQLATTGILRRSRRAATASSTTWRWCAIFPPPSPPLIARHLLEEGFVDCFLRVPPPRYPR